MMKQVQTTYISALQPQSSEQRSGSRALVNNEPKRIV